MIPTNQSYDAMVFAYQFFNDRLFDDSLPDVLISYQRKARTRGFVSYWRWVGDAGFSHELGMNPKYFAGYAAESVLGTLIHEMVHVQQETFGKPGRRGYHNKEWGRLMRDVGLEPSSTGAPGGKDTGQQMTHFFRYGGPAWQAVRALIDEEEFTIPWLDRFPHRNPSSTPLIELYDDQDRLVDRDGEPIVLESTNGAPEDEELPTEGSGGGPEPMKPVIPPNVLGGQLEGSIKPESRGKKTNGSNRNKYACPEKGCRAQVWGKPGLQIGCFCGEKGGAFIETT